jgi:HPt (histidine-containing phosphotransfer) domain-containing protein
LKIADLSYLENMTDGNFELILEIIDIFVVQVEDYWNQMDCLNRAKDFDALGKLAHKAKSSVAIMGMKSASKKLKNLELLCLEEKNTDQYIEIISNFKSESELVIEELLEYKKKQLAQKN